MEETYHETNFSSIKTQKGLAYERAYPALPVIDIQGRFLAAMYRKELLPGNFMRDIMPPFFLQTQAIERKINHRFKRQACRRAYRLPFLSKKLQRPLRKRVVLVKRRGTAEDI
jgi:hypothetical protein